MMARNEDALVRWTDGPWVKWVVWSLRLIVGAVFVVSGLAKAIDLWGVVFKFEEYFAAWGVSVPLSLTVMGAMALSSVEFLLGCLLAAGCFRRTVVWGLIAMMAVMLPLTFYVWIKDPVPDCGCFGDFLILSNGTTFFKNILITLALVFLALANRKAGYLYHPYSQWLCGVACLVFITLVELYGFNIQPMVDFRSFPVGRSLVDAGNDEEPEFEFLYSKDGEVRIFAVDSLPDSTWTFVDRRVIEGSVDPDAPAEATDLMVLDVDGENVTNDVISGSGLEMLVVVPQHERADMYYTSFTNELNSAMTRAGGSLVELTDMSADSIDTMRDDFMAEFPVFHAESTVLKELSRGVVSVVLLRDGVIQWKRNMGSIDVEALTSSPRFVADLEGLGTDGHALLIRWSWMLVAVLAGVLVVDKILCLTIIRRKNGKAENKCLNLQKDTPDSGESRPEAEEGSR